MPESIPFLQELMERVVKENDASAALMYFQLEEKMTNLGESPVKDRPKIIGSMIEEAGRFSESAEFPGGYRRAWKEALPFLRRVAHATRHVVRGCADLEYPEVSALIARLEKCPVFKNTTCLDDSEVRMPFLQHLRIKMTLFRYFDLGGSDPPSDRSERIRVKYLAIAAALEMGVNYEDAPDECLTMWRSIEGQGWPGQPEEMPHSESLKAIIQNLEACKDHRGMTCVVNGDRKSFADHLEKFLDIKHQMECAGEEPSLGFQMHDSAFFRINAAVRHGQKWGDIDESMREVWIHFEGRGWPGQPKEVESCQ